ncbi:MAG: UDP-N-acetylmuramoyl-tripeptide--D-alanyl-D-alanine ligase [Pseudomonadales bacterium]|nr:UDP-N-acetylmuramoyl-tripeptide--D-alanyl-D-alanine ligase [Pseudomonadales bacterium]NRA16369.1 UDP-N-acetylmuramoyl-tripeptide--D-alanyl-D-alanine ligase [Oceanospirillaceae bacterium]
MSYPMLLSDLAAITDGQLQGADYLFESLSTDTRKVQAGDVFLALTGENFDGHQFCQQAVAAGAAALVVERPLDLDVPQLVVKNCHLALGLIAKCNRDKYQGPLIAVTGSNGKTTTKELIASILAGKGNTLATLGNLNNEIGVPLTLLRFNGQQQYSVVEMGANAKGEINYCAALARPDVAIITNAMGAHLEGFGSLQGVVEAKAEIFQGLSVKGTAVINLDDNNVNQWLTMLKTDRGTAIKYLSFSLENPEADVYASHLQQLTAGNYSFELHFCDHSATVTLQLLAIHNVLNALAAAAAVFAIGGSMQEVVRGLENAPAIGGRLQALRAINNATLIDDSYNGNPDSVKAGVDLLAQLPGRKILALGDMAELGVDEKQLHQSVGTYAAQQGIDYLFSCGPLGELAAREFAAATGSQLTAFANKDKMLKILKTMMNAQTKILIKGSLSSGMKQVVNELTQGSVS